MTIGFRVRNALDFSRFEESTIIALTFMVLCIINVFL